MLDREHSAPPVRQYATFGNRFIALLIDSIITSAFLIPIFLLFIIFRSSIAARETETLPAFFGITIIASILAFLAFFIWNSMIRTGKTGQSLGCKIMNIAVLTEHGEPIGIGYSVFRETIGRYISQMICYVGYLNAIWDEKNQTWHDKMSNSYVYEVEDNFS